MPAPPPDDVRAAARLAAQAAEGAADLAEAAHAVIVRPWRRGPRTRGISGLVYRSVRRGVRLAGRLADLGLSLRRPSSPRSARREAWVAALNGVRGDALAASGDPLATTLHLRHGSRPLVLAPDALRQSVADPSDVLVVRVHGICMHDGQWGREQAAALAEGLGATDLAARYNSGRHISETGRDLDAALAALVDGWPVAVRRLVIVGHSMGGLVARSAVQAAQEAGRDWLGRDVSLVTLGSPHHGAPLERLGNAVDRLLGATRWSRPFARIGQVRSAGVTDLRWGTVRDHDWAGQDRFASGRDVRSPTPLPPGVAVYAVAAVTGDRHALRDQTVGDGLVPLDSALGRHADPAFDLALPPGRRWVATGLSHFDLTHDPAVTAQMLAWLAPDSAGRS